MIIRFLFFLALGVMIFFWAKRYIDTSPPEQKRSRKITLGLIAFAGLMLVLTATGRMHWLGAAIAVLVPLFKELARILLPALLHRKIRAATSNSEQSTPAGQPMTEKDAEKILGLTGNYTKEDIIEAHRILMQKLHPDRGGNDFLAAQLNQAKEMLLKKF